MYSKCIQSVFQVYSKCIRVAFSNGNLPETRCLSRAAIYPLPFSCRNLPLVFLKHRFCTDPPPKFTMSVVVLADGSYREGKGLAAASVDVGRTNAALSRFSCAVMPQAKDAWAECGALLCGMRHAMTDTYPYPSMATGEGLRERERERAIERERESERASRIPRALRQRCRDGRGQCFMFLQPFLAQVLRASATIAARPCCARAHRSPCR